MNGYAFSYGTISKLVATLDAHPQAFATRELDNTRFRRLILDVRYEKVLEHGAVETGTVQIAVGIDAAGKRHLLAVELVEKARVNSWITFLTGLKERGLQGVEYDVSNSHEGLKCAIEKVLTAALWQCCAVHFSAQHDGALFRTKTACPNRRSGPRTPHKWELHICRFMSSAA